MLLRHGFLLFDPISITLQEKVKCFRQRAFALWAEEICGDDIRVRFTAPDDDEGVEKVRVDVGCGKEGFGEL